MDIKINVCNSRAWQKFGMNELVTNSDRLKCETHNEFHMNRILFYDFMKSQEIKIDFRIPDYFFINSRLSVNLNKISFKNRLNCGMWSPPLGTLSFSTIQWTFLSKFH